MLHPYFVIVGAFLSILGTSSYIFSTLKGKTRPNRVSFFLWFLISLIAVSAELSEGVGIQSLMTFMVGFGPLLVFLASFVNKKSTWKLSKFDYFCGSLSVIGLILWMLTREGNVAILFAILADGLAAVPTVTKSYKEPESENSLAYGLSAIAAVLTLATVDMWNFAHYGFPLYILLIDIVLFSLIQFKLGYKFRSHFQNQQMTSLF